MTQHTPDTPLDRLLADGKTLVLFDGACGFCQRSVRFIAGHDPDDTFRFSPRDSAIGAEAQARFGIDPATVDSMVVVDQQQARVRSEGVIEITRHLPAPWRWAAAAGLIPRPLRDGVYRLIAKNRHHLSKLRGNADACPTPTDALRARLI